ncbi:hypothetical protein BO82DRAFT_17123 [Aspergillus uvarum CBS 121591]|uniref:Uncharacterized protein n=1 Tax=Aspergillus uvarum CBS 121591 TaxID=1448315 RepID=A0A319CGK8_9EURO|nr:hypothetical protein BO82DRAFT_17123 [Aspergillus uvarum CBS 121591]PYH84364.1 hypothetical protein BO82DRAFT_17123 [Aspergillus uvarum CBS 121591]
MQWPVVAWEVKAKIRGRLGIITIPTAACNLLAMIVFGYAFSPVFSVNGISLQCFGCLVVNPSVPLICDWTKFRVQQKY